MATVISGEKLKKLVEENRLIKNAKSSNCKGLKYDFTLSNKFLKSKCKTPQNYEELSLTERKEFALIAPGEVVYFLSEEIVHMPKNMYAQLTPKRKMGELGINVNCALFIDPEYEGVLVFGFYNYSSENFSFSPGLTFASAVFYELDDNELFDYSTSKKPEKILDFQPNLIATISKCDPIGITELSRSVEKMKGDINEIKEDLSDNKKWVRDVEKVIEDLSQENTRITKNLGAIADDISSLNEALKAEKNNREESDKGLSRKIDAETNERKNSFGIIRSLIGVGLVVLGGAGSLFIAWLTGLINLATR